MRDPTSPADGGDAASLRFGPGGRFELQPGQRLLLVDGRPAALGGRAYDLLVVLASSRGRLISKAELLDRVWPGVIVEEANLQVQISHLRKIVGTEAIVTVPGRGYRFAADVDRAAAPPERSASSGAATVPSGLSLFGRDADLKRLREALQAPLPCVTLIGPPGVGKTTLAHVVCAGWPAPSHWVDLTTVSDALGALEAIARACGAASTGAIAAQLARPSSGGPRLVVLDNAEHLAAACAGWIASLGGLPHARLLVTSQVALGLDGERLHHLEPLAVDAASMAVDPRGRMGHGALALLVERAAAIDRRFVPTAAVLPALRAICVQLDGLPLALEMAAARIPMLGARAVQDGLAERFAMLTRGHRDAQTRHRTLGSALAWSYQLLEPDEQRLFRALGVFVGGFTADLAVRVAADDPSDRWPVFDRLATLVERSLVVLDPVEDPPRYRLLETMRAYASECGLAAGDDLPTLSLRHARALLDLLEARRQEVGAAGTFGPVEAEMPNVREAVGWSRRHALALAVDLAQRAAEFATFSSWRSEIATWLTELHARLEQPEGAALPVELRAAWWRQYARALVMQGSRDAREVARRSYAVQQELDDPAAVMRAAIVWLRSIREPGAELGAVRSDVAARAAALDPPPNDQTQLQVQGALTWADTVRGDWEAVLAGRRHELELARRVGKAGTIDAVESNMALALNRLGRHREAEQLARPLLERVRAGGRATYGNLPWVFSGLLEASIALGRLDDAKAWVAAASASADEAGAWVVKPLLCALAVAQGRPRAAARLLGHAQASLAASGGQQAETWQVEALEHCRSAVEASLGEPAAQALCRQGRELDDAAAAALAASDEP